MRQVVRTGDEWEAMMADLRPRPTWAVDTETTGLGIRDRLFGVSIRALGGATSYYLPFRHLQGANLPNACLAALVRELHGHELIGFNFSGFDYRMLLREGLDPGLLDVWDVLLGWYLKDENEKRGLRLEAIAERELGPDSTVEQRRMDELLVSRLLTKADMNRLSPEQVCPYACEDVELSLALYEKAMDLHRSEGTVDVWAGLSRYGQVLATMLERGLPVDLEECRRRKHQAVEAMNEAIMTAHRKAGRVIRLGSPKAVAQWLGVDTTAIDELEKHLDLEKDWRLSTLVGYRQAQRAVSAYYNPMLSRTTPEGRYHADLVLIGTVTGRPAHWGGRGSLNVLALPRDTDAYGVKSCFVAPPGWVFIEADLAGAELRLASHYAQESRMLALLRAGVNVHKATAEKLGIPYQAAKRINFSIIYGIGSETLAINLGIDVDTAHRWLAAHRREYPGFPSFYRSANAVAERRGYVRMWTGRRRHYIGPDPAYHKAADHIIQGGVNELIRIKQTELHEELRDVKQILQVYDSCIMLAPEELAPARARQVREIMRYDGFSVPMEVDVKIGRNLGDMQEAA